MMKMVNPRDTQFAGFAELLLAEIANTDGWKLADVEKLVAQRAYDLALHICEDFGRTYSSYDIWGFSEGESKEAIIYCTDMAKWPAHD